METLSTLPLSSAGTCLYKLQVILHFALFYIPFWITFIDKIYITIIFKMKMRKYSNTSHPVLRLMASSCNIFIL